tara:strand:+ start:12537 stop:12803 length:267 start_codon:yes stop_codon:yes gene_type:complete
MRIRIIVWGEEDDDNTRPALHFEEIFPPPAMVIAYGIQDPDAKEEMITYAQGKMFQEGFTRDMVYSIYALVPDRHGVDIVYEIHTTKD